MSSEREWPSLEAFADVLGVGSWTAPHVSPGTVDYGAAPIEEFVVLAVSTETPT